jgi:calcineurin-like phosphoesterase family protein
MNWFTSDLHINHHNIIEYCKRPFASTKEMNESLVQRWNEKVLDSDTVYVVGDVFLGDHTSASKLIRDLRGRKVLISGNHDRSPRTMKECGFADVFQRKSLTLVDGRRAILCHKPLPDSVIGEYDLQVHGHRHSGPTVCGRRINVCVDLWNFTPISEDEICQIQLEEPIKDRVEVTSTGDFVNVSASVKKEDLEGLIDHLQDYARTLWYNRNKE